ncbi:MAG: cation transporter [Thermoleophilaceae bacterium]|nr:cation transporter [Thermoleophilaceae bacterium]
MTAHGETSRRQQRLLRMIYLAIAAALLTIALKAAAWLITGSVGLLADAAESLVNLAAAFVALIVIRWAGQPADEDHAYGHDKADYLSAGAEGTMIIVAAIVIAYSAIERLINPVALESVGVGLVITGVATVINLVVARLLIQVGRAESSQTLQADGRHLMTDVITSVGVILGVALVAVTGIDRLDPIIALIVAVNIIATGGVLVRGALSGLLDHALEPEEIDKVEAALDGYRAQGISFHALRTRRAAHRAFISLHVLVPGDWSVQQGHDVAEQIEADLRDLFDTTTVFTHLEPIEDPVSFEDTKLDREDAGAAH